MSGSEAEQIFGDYSDAVEPGDDEEPGLYDDVDEDGIPFDAEIEGIFAIKSLNAWEAGEESKNPGKRWFKAILECVELYRCEQHPKDNEKPESEIVEGRNALQMNELPRSKTVSDMTRSERFNLREALDLGAAVLGVKQQQFDPGSLGELCAKDSKVAGWKIGVEVDSTVKQKEINGEQIEVVYYNVEDFYPVDDGTHERLPEKDAE